MGETFNFEAPICDTNIWINIVFGEITQDIFKQHSLVYVADVVEKEIKDFRNNPDKRAQMIADEFQTCVSDKVIKVIRHSDIPIEDRKVLERSLVEMGFTTGLKDVPHEFDKGEFVSALYLNHYELPFFKTDDSSFKPGGKGLEYFPDIVVKDWYAVVEGYLSDFNRKIIARKSVDEKRKFISSSKRKDKQVPRTPKTVDEFKSMMNARRLS